VTRDPSVRAFGDRGFLVELADNPQVHLLAAAARDRFGPQLEDVVPGEETLLLRWAGPPPAVAELTRELASLDLHPSAAAAVEAPAVTIPVRYDGADLDAVAEAAGLEVARVIELHSQAEYLVAFMGFAPGFAYMTGADRRLHLPRREEPRSRVPAGAVAIASTYTAVYPTSAPGGWHLLGHTDAVLFDADRDPPALLQAGARVVFEPR
jgi:KipI family sensor histidine kinase inhibitor